MDELHPDEVEELMNEFSEQIDREFACTVMIPSIGDDGHWDLKPCGANPVEFDKDETSGRGVMMCEEGHKSILEAQ